MFGILLSSALLLATTPDTGHQAHANPPLALDDALLASVRNLAVEDGRYVADKRLARAKRRWIRQCKHKKKSGALRRPVRCENRRQDLLALLDRHYPAAASPYASLTPTQDRMAAAARLAATWGDRAAALGLKPPTLPASVEAARAVVVERKKETERARTNADAALVAARAQPDDPELAKAAILADKAAHDAAKLTEAAQDDERSVAIHHAATVADDALTSAQTAATAAPATDAALKNARADEKPRCAAARA